MKQYSVLETQRLKLRRPQISDLEEMIALESDPEVVRFTRSRYPLTRQKILERLENTIKLQAERDPLGVWVAESRSDGIFVGWFMLIQTEFEGPELGFMINKKLWGLGYASEAASHLTKMALEVLNHSSIFAVTDSDNEASMKVLQKVGFKKISSRIKFDPILNKDVEGLVFQMSKSR